MLKDDGRFQRSTFNLQLFPLIGAAILAAVTVATLPWKAGLFRRPRTIFDQSVSKAIAPGYGLIVAASGLVPPGANVLVRTEPRDPVLETFYHRIADSLLPGRRALPASLHSRPTPPEMLARADYVVIVGAKPSEPVGRLLLQTPDGTVWRMPK